MGTGPRPNGGDVGHNGPVDTDEVLGLIQEVSAEVIEPRFRELSAAEIHEKNPGDLVTVADHDAEALLIAALRSAYPQAVLLGEEANAANPDSMAAFLGAEHAFTIDPVDGTKNFVNGSPDHAVMVAEVRAGETVRCWIWQPQHRAAYVAELGAGAFRNGERLSRSAPPVDPADWRGVTSRRPWIGRSLSGLTPLELTWVCCGVDYPQLIAGAADYIVYGAANPWDHAPGTLLLTESGGYSGLSTGSGYRAASTSESDPTAIPYGLIAAADRHTFDTVRTLLP